MIIFGVFLSETDFIFTSRRLEVLNAHILEAFECFTLHDGAEAESHEPLSAVMHIVIHTCEAS